MQILALTEMHYHHAVEECELAMEVIARTLDLDLEGVEVDVDTDAEHSSEYLFNCATYHIIQI